MITNQQRSLSVADGSSKQGLSWLFMCTGEHLPGRGPVCTCGSTCVYEIASLHTQRIVSWALCGCEWAHGYGEVCVCVCSVSKGRWRCVVREWHVWAFVHIFVSMGVCVCVLYTHDRVLERRQVAGWACRRKVPLDGRHTSYVASTGGNSMALSPLQATRWTFSPPYSDCSLLGLRSVTPLRR